MIHNVAYTHLIPGTSWDLGCSDAFWSSFSISVSGSSVSGGVSKTTGTETKTELSFLCLEVKKEA